MHVLMTGSPYDGFKLFGPFVSEEAATPAVRHHGRWDHQWTFELNAGLEVVFDEADPDGSAVVFAGSIIGDPEYGDGWMFIGPFRNIEAARKWAWADGLGTDCAIELRPVKELELELETA